MIDDEIVSLKSLAHASTTVFMENASPWSCSYRDGFEIWDKMIVNGELYELAKPHAMNGQSQFVVEGRFRIDTEKCTVCLSVFFFLLFLLICACSQ